MRTRSNKAVFVRAAKLLIIGDKSYCCSALQSSSFSFSQARVVAILFSDFYGRRLDHVWPFALDGSKNKDDQSQLARSLALLLCAEAL